MRNAQVPMRPAMTKKKSERQMNMPLHNIMAIELTQTLIPTTPTQQKSPTPNR